MSLSLNFQIKEMKKKPISTPKPPKPEIKTLLICMIFISVLLRKKKKKIYGKLKIYERKTFFSHHI